MTANEDRLHRRGRGEKDPTVCVSTVVPIQFELELEYLHAVALIVEARVGWNVEARRETQAENLRAESMAIRMLTQQRLIMIFRSIQLLAAERISQAFLITV